MAKRRLKLPRLGIPSARRSEYRAGEITLRQLADQFGVASCTIWRELKRGGICRDSRRGRPPSSRKRSLVLALASLGHTRREIAEKLGVTAEWVRTILADNGLAVSLQVLKCKCCRTPVAKGHKAYQGTRPLCVACVQQRRHVPFAQRLLAFRLARELSRAQLAFQAGLSPALVGNYERGVGRPTPQTTRKLALALEVTIADLVGPRPP
jgi:transcriptional regulator with XRE-family HTH domain